MSRGAQWSLVAVLVAAYGVTWWLVDRLHASLFGAAIGALACGRVLWLHHWRHQPQPGIGTMWFALMLIAFQVVVTLREEHGPPARIASAAPEPRPCAYFPTARPPDECGLDALRPSALGLGVRVRATVP